MIDQNLHIKVKFEPAKKIEFRSNATDLEYRVMAMEKFPVMKRIIGWVDSFDVHQAGQDDDYYSGKPKMKTQKFESEFPN